MQPQLGGKNVPKYDAQGLKFEGLRLVKNAVINQLLLIRQRLRANAACQQEKRSDGIMSEISHWRGLTIQAERPSPRDA